MQPPPPSPHTLARALPVCAAAVLPACYLGALIYKYGVDVPYLEQWPVALYFEKLFQGTLKLSDLFQQQNEFRQFFPNLLFLALGSLTRWNVRYEMLAIFALACLSSFNLYRLGALTIGGENYSQRLAALLLTNVLIFSPLQFDTWLYGIQVVYLVPMACITTGLLVALSGWHDRTKFGVCMCLSTLSAFSSANGMLCWVALLFVLVRPWPLRVALFEKRWLLTAWLAGFISNCALYLYGYRKPAGHPSLLVGVEHPLRATLYFFSYLGTPLGWGKYKFTVLAGVAFAVCYAAACAYLLANRRDETLARRMTPWLALGLFALLTGVMITFSRVGFGIGQSSELRYIAFSLYLIACLAHLMPVVLSDLKNKGAFKTSGTVFVRLIPVTLLLLVLMLHLRFYPLGVHFMKRVRLDRTRAKACLMFINVLPDACPSEPDTLALDMNFIKLRANALDAHGYLRPGLVRSARVAEIEARDIPDDERRGLFENLSVKDGDTYAASGWARRTDNIDAPVDIVLLAYEPERDATTQPSAVVFKLSEPCAQHRPPTLTAAEVECTGLRWRARFSASEIPPGTGKLTAWAFDAGTGRALRLTGTHTINKSGASPVSVKFHD